MLFEKYVCFARCICHMSLIHALEMQHDYHTCVLWMEQLHLHYWSINCGSHSQCLRSLISMSISSHFHCCESDEFENCWTCDWLRSRTDMPGLRWKFSRTCRSVNYPLVFSWVGWNSTLTQSHSRTLLQSVSLLRKMLFYYINQWTISIQFWRLNVSQILYLEFYVQSVNKIFITFLT